MDNKKIDLFQLKKARYETIKAEKIREAMNDVDRMIADIDNFEKMNIEELEALQLDVPKSEKPQGNSNLDSADKFTKYRKKSKKGIIILIAAAVMALGVGGIGLSERSVALESDGEVAGEDMIRVIGSELENENIPSVNELEAYEVAKEVMGSPIVWIDYINAEITYSKIDISEDQTNVNIIWESNDHTILYTIVGNQDGITYYNVQEEDSADINHIDKDGVSISIAKYYDKDVKSEVTTISFSYNNLYYQMTGCIEEKEVSKIIDNLIFF